MISEVSSQASHEEYHALDVASQEQRQDPRGSGGEERVGMTESDQYHR